MAKGGARKGAGRKTKAEEQKVMKRSQDAIIRIYGSLDAYFDYIAKQSKDSFPHLKLLHEYSFGKVADKIEDVSENKEIKINLIG